MSTYIRNFYPGVYCHIYNRGAARQNIFNDDIDYLTYLKKLREIREKCDISLICYCLMPNHLHLLVRQDGEMSISRFMHSLHTRYSMYFNKKHNRSGHLFQGAFRQKNIEDDRYLLHLSFYIHLNPVANKSNTDLENYKWSSYPDYIGKRNGTLCDKEMIIREQSIEEYKQLVKKVREEMEESQKEKGKGSPFNLWLNEAKS
ncbi:transposase [Patescibacteria group bacterium]